ncbi:MAG: hypothetical protein M9894_37990 [Planctomycetes bacterium]|nr:hypothetical protein [Planctomycetota bacterium]
MMRTIAGLALVLLFAAPALATDFAVKAGDARGHLSVRLRSDGCFDVALRLADVGAFTGVASGTLAGLEGTLRSEAGLVGAVAGVRAREGRVALAVDPAAGRCQGALVVDGESLPFEGARPASAPAGAAYEGWLPWEKQETVWRAASATPYATLPAIGGRGVGGSVWDTLQALRLPLLERTFSTASDVRPARTKIFHPFGSVARVVYEPVGDHPYTGLFASGAPGIARLSLATDEKSFIPGIALKLFVQGRPSVNVHAIPSFDAQEGRDFFLRAPTNVIPEPSALPIKLFARLASRIADPLRRSVGHLAAVDLAGATVREPVAPGQVHFRPAQVRFPAGGRDDFRTQLATIPEGTVIYAVHAVTKEGEVHVGNVRTTSRFVASDWGDRVLHFLHAR